MLLAPILTQEPFCHSWPGVARTLFTNTFVINWITQSSFSSKSLKHCLSQTGKAKEQKFWDNVYPQPSVTFYMSIVTNHVSHVTCHVSSVMFHKSCVTYNMSCVTCHMSHVTCHKSRVTCHIKFCHKMAELVS